MDNRANLFYPESVNEQVKQLMGIQDQQQRESTPGAPTIAALQSIYKEDEAILEHAWLRLANLKTATPPSENTTQAVERHANRGENSMAPITYTPEVGDHTTPSVPTPMRPTKRPRQHRWRAIGLIAATLTAMVIASSTLWIINARQSGTTSTGTPKKTPVAVSTDAIYEGSQDGLLRVNPKTGKVIWSYQLPTQDSTAQVSFAQILLAGNTVYGLKQDVTATSTQIIAFSAATGRILWSYDTPGIRSMALEHDTLYLGVNDSDINSNRSYIHILNATNGTSQEKTYTLRGFAPNLSLVDDTLYVATETSLSAIDVIHAQQLWQKNIADLIAGTGYVTISGFSVVHGIVYATSIAAHGVYGLALHASNGNMLWRTDAIGVKGASGGGAGIIAPVASATTVYFTIFGNSGGVFAYDAQKGTLRWSYKLTGPLVQRTPVLSNNNLFISEDIISTGSPKTRFAALNATTGKLIWQTTPKAGVSTQGFALNGIYYVATAYTDSPSITYAFASSTGKILWQSPLGKNPSVLAGGQSN